MRRYARLIRRNWQILPVNTYIVLVAVLFLGGVFGIFAYAIDRGYPIELARTMAMNTLVVMEMVVTAMMMAVTNSSSTLR